MNALGILLSEGSEGALARLYLFVDFLLVERIEVRVDDSFRTFCDDE